ncbi:hypothetical protein D0Z00_004146 [Geotrichum galactomycetum]|uniref:Uncharacterized protein n=1 Tax=Geotrichum galactomycetum TaxID=27317 RepID=A0ACB6UZA6_9ASCO|nr:hypothetical protein D0Z00_004146 [Geotrichum candidum]
MPSNSRRGTTATSVSTTPRTNPLPSSALSLELSPDPTDPNNITRSKQAVSLANLFINYTVASTSSPSDLRRNLSTGPTVRTFQNPIENADDLIRSGSKLENAILDTFERVEISPSPQTLVRAQKARANMEIHYDLLASYQGVTTRPEGLDNEGRSSFAALPNFYTYNPLQVIRNRKVRTPFVALESQTPNASSSASHHHWTVDISEFISDQPWRYQNYHLIRDAKGKLRYPSTTTVAERDSALSKNMIVSRLNKLKQNLTNNNGSRSRNSSISENTTPDSDVSRQPSIDERHRTGIFNVPIESIQKSKPLDLHSDSTSSINSHNFTTTDTNNNHNPSNTNTPFSDKKSKPQLKNTLAQNNSRAVPEDDRRQNSIGSDVAPSAGLTPACDSSAEIEPEPVPVVDVERKTVCDAATELGCLELIYLMRYLSIGNKVTVMSDKNGFIPAAARDVEVKQISTEFHQQVRAVQRDVFPRVKKAVQQREEQMQTLRRAQLSKTSTRIDKLLVDTDQTINRLATTLNLEVKQLSERMDLLERSAHKVRYKWLILNASYLLLEYLLVFVMWIVWGLVSIMLGVRRVGSIFGRIIKWLLWC